MASSSSGCRTYDVFPSFRGEDVRDSFLSHLLKALKGKSISTFIDNGIERSCEIGHALLSAIRGAKISIVIFSKNYASSKWCLDELVEIHKCYKGLSQKVIPIFYNVDPSEVRKQTGEFEKVFKETCKDKPEVQIQMWKQALTDIANLAGEHLKKGVDEARVVEKIANDVSNKVIISPSNYSDGLVGIEAHIEAMKSRLCLESEEVRMVGTVGASGIGKSTIGRELYTQISRKFPYRIYATYRKTNQDNCAMKLDWAQKFLWEILGQKEIKVLGLGEVKQRLKDKKVLIVLDDVDNLELLETLVGNTDWFGPGSRIIVITQDKHLLKAHDIDHIYEVEFPSKTLALEMLCQYAFKQSSPPDGFKEVTIEVAKFAGNLPLGLSVLGSSLRKRSKDEWMEMLPRLQNILDGDIGKQLRVSYNRLDKDNQHLFLYVACHFSGFAVEKIQKWFGESVNIGLRMLVEKSLLRVVVRYKFEIVEMHDLLKKLGREILLAESNDPGKRRFLVDVDDIRYVLTNNTGTHIVQGIILDRSDVIEKISVHKNSFQSMRNIQIIIIFGYPWSNNDETLMDLPQDLVSLPHQLRVLCWDNYSAKCLPSTFKAEFLVRLIMKRSKLEKLWEGTLALGNLKVMDMSQSLYLQVIPDLSKAINLEELRLYHCTSLVTLSSSIQNLTKLSTLNMKGCKKLENIPILVNLESLTFFNIDSCKQLRNFPKISLDNSRITVKRGLWSSNIPRLVFLDCLMRYIPRQYRPEHFTYITVCDSKIEKLWEGVQCFLTLEEIELSDCDYLKEIPDLSKATILKTLRINGCKSLLMVPSTIGNLQKLKKLEMCHCTKLKGLPIDVNLSSLRILNFNSCSRLSVFPKISNSIEELYLNETAIEGVPCFIENFSRLRILTMCCCERLKNISPNIFRLTNLEQVDFSDCGDVITVLSDVSAVTTKEDNFWRTRGNFNFENCFKLDKDAREFIVRSCFKPTVLPGREVPTYFKHRAFGNSLIVTLPQSVLSQDILQFKTCVVFEAPFKCPEGLDLNVHYLFNGMSYEGFSYRFMMFLCERDHLVLCSFRIKPTDLSPKLKFNNVEFKFGSPERIKGCGIQLLNVSLSPDGGDGRYETTYNQQSGDKCDVVETGGSKKRMRMASGTS